MGLMGEIASTVYAGLGEENVIGVIPEALQPREVISIVVSGPTSLQANVGRTCHGTPQQQQDRHKLLQVVIDAKRTFVFSDLWTDLWRAPYCT